MKKVVGKISKKQLDTMIQEELAKMKKLVALKERKEAAEREIRNLKETYGIDEVRSSGQKDKGDAYYMQDLPVQDFEEKRNGTVGHSVALKEMDGMDKDECGELETMFAELGRKLDAVLAGQEELSDDHEELSDDHEEMMDSSEEDEIEVDMEDEIEVDMKQEDDETMDEEDGETMEEQEGETMEEQEGEAIVNAADQDTVNHNMKKVDNDNPMANKIYEGRKLGKKVVKEHQHINPSNNPLINEELERMRRLANL